MTKEEQLKKKEDFLKYFRALPIQKLAAGYIAVDEDTITNWKKSDTKFSDDVERAASEWAKENASKVRSKEWLLERVMKGHFAQRSPLLDDAGKPIPLLSKLDVSNNNSPKETEES